MTDDRRRLVEEIFAEAAACDAAADVDAVLRSRCGSDAALRAEVESLLGFAGGDDPLLDRPVVALDGTIASEFSGVGEDAASLTPGAMFGHYRIIRMLGSGGMGVVYLAESDRPRRQVALKVIRAGGASRSILRRFERETQVLAMLRHPGIAHIYETGAADTGEGPQPFFAMEYVEGPNLLDFARDRALTNRQRLELLALVADAVQHAHDRGVIHRDLKPGNILVQPASPTRGETSTPPPSRSGETLTHGTGGGAVVAGQPKVLDFGVARIVDPTGTTVTVVTSAGQLIGTLAYMSPEQVSGRVDTIDARSDVYALGVLLYELLAGQPPIDVRDKATPEAVRAVRDDEPKRLGSIDRVLRGDIETIAAKALEKDPGRRYPSAGALAEDIRRFLRDEPIVARPPSTLYQARKFASRNRVLVAGLATTFAALLAGFVGVGIVATIALRQRDIAREAVKSEQLATSAAKSARDDAVREEATAKQVAAFLNRVLLEAHPQYSGGRDVTIMEAIDTIAGAIDKDFKDKSYIAASLHLLVGRIYQGHEKPEKAKPHFVRAFDLLRQEVGEAHRQTLNARFELAVQARRENRLEESVALTAEGLRLCRESLGEQDALTCYYLMEQARVAIVREDFLEAERLLRLAVDTYSVTGRNDVDSRVARVTLAKLLAGLNQAAEAAELMEGLLDDAKAHNSTPNPSLIDAISTSARIAVALKDFPEAEALYREAADMAAVLWGPDGSRTMGYLDNLAGAIAEQGKWDEAEAIIRRVYASRLAEHGETHDLTNSSRRNLAWLLTQTGRREEAIPLEQAVMDAAIKQYGEGHKSTFAPINSLGSSLHHVGRDLEAEPLFERLSAAASRALPEGHKSVALYNLNLAIVKQALGKEDEAETALLAAQHALRAGGNDPGLSVKVENMLAEIRSGSGRPGS